MIYILSHVNEIQADFDYIEIRYISVPQSFHLDATRLIIITVITFIQLLYIRGLLITRFLILWNNIFSRISKNQINPG